MDLGNFKHNENYGNGVFYRRIRIVKTEGLIHAALEDCFHGFQVSVFHDGEVITRVEPQFMRVPFTSCSGAKQPLLAFVGMPLAEPLPVMLERVDPIKNCTHLYDLTCWAIAQSQNDLDEIIYDIRVADAVDGKTTVEVKRNSSLIHSWDVEHGTVIAPEHLAGKPLFKGFYQWVNADFSGVELEAALVLQKGNMVSMGRMLDLDGMVGNRAADEHQRSVCHTYSDENRDTARRLANTSRDFTDHPEQLLKFL